MWHATVKAGGGLTIGSDPAAEVREAKLKVGCLLVSTRLLGDV